MSRLYDKFTVTRTDGEERPDAKYFVLDYGTDVFARLALLAYARYVGVTDPELACELIAEVEAETIAAANRMAGGS